MGEEYEIVESVEIQPDTEDVSMGPDADMAPPVEAVEQEGDILEPVPVDTGEYTADTPVDAAEVPASVSSDRVDEIVEAVLSDDRVTGLLDSFEYTMQTVTDMASAATEAVDREAAYREVEDREEDTRDPVVVISADELLDRLEVRQAESAQAAQAAQSVQAPVKSSSMDGQTVAASVPAATRGGEILVPEGGEVAVIDVIAQLVQAIYDHFTENDNDNLSGIRETLTEIKSSVEPHPLLDTPFEEYTVTEGLLLVAVLWFVVLTPCIKMLKGGFSWLN